MKNNSYRKLLRVLIACSLVFSFLTACGGPSEPATYPAAGEYPSPGEPVAVETGAPVDAPTEAAPDAQPTGAIPASGEGEVEADSGFRPQMNGFSFENYGGDERVENLTPASMQRMFGDQVCANQAGGECTLTPPAQEWMDTVNKSMAGGHCEGMAVLSALMYFGQINPGQFGGEAASDLRIQNEELQREIAYWFTTQYTSPGGEGKVNASPAAVVDTLVQAFAQGQNASEWWALGIYQPDISGGHAVTPIAVDDKGGGLYSILVYDNNFPGEIRAVEVDYNANTWQYLASTNPNEPEALYQGDASTQTLEVVAISPRMLQQACTFCMGGGQSSRRAGLAAPAEQFYEITLEGAANLIIEDEGGRRIGYVDGKFVNDIPGASQNPVKMGVEVWGQEYEPVYRVPLGKSFMITIDASLLEQPITASVSMIGPGYFLSVDDIELEAGEQDSIAVTVDGSRRQVTYITDYEESPEVMMGVETEQADYAFLVQATELVGAEDTFDVGIDLATGEFLLNTDANTEASTYDFYVLRIDDEGASAFGTVDFSMHPDTTIYLQYLNWAENGASMQAEIDYQNDGQIDETIELPDTSDEFEWE